MNHSHIGRARLLSSRGGPYHVCPASYSRPDPEQQGRDAIVPPTFLSAGLDPVPKPRVDPSARQACKPAVRRMAAGLPNKFLLPFHHFRWSRVSRRAAAVRTTPAPQVTSSLNSEHYRRGAAVPQAFRPTGPSANRGVGDWVQLSRIESPRNAGFPVFGVVVWAAPPGQNVTARGNAPGNRTKRFCPVGAKLR